MKDDQNIVHIRQGIANPLPQIRNFHAKAHCLRSQALRGFAHDLVTGIINLRKRFVDYRSTRRLYKELSAMDSRQLNDIGLTRNDLERIKLGRAGILALQQEQAVSRVRNTSVLRVVVACQHEPTLPEAMGQ